jgi:hypothetical protein
MDCKAFSPTFARSTNTLVTDCLHRYGPEDQVGYCARPDMFRCIKDVNKLVMPISYSSANDFLTCHYLYYLKQIRGIAVRDIHKSPALKMGALWDVALQRLLGADINVNDTVEIFGIENREVAKVRAMNRAYKALGIEPEKGYEVQRPFIHKLNVYENSDSHVLVRGFYDRAYADHFVENKLTGKPDFYLDIYFIQSQIGTYFLVDKDMKSVTMEIARTPELRSVGQYKDETDEAYEERVFQDIISRPSHYFIGWNNQTKTYGKKYYRGEFDLEEIAGRYKNVVREIRECSAFDGWYKNDRVCNNILPGIQCDMLGVCRHNVMSETIYTIRKEVL